MGLKHTIEWYTKNFASHSLIDQNALVKSLMVSHEKKSIHVKLGTLSPMSNSNLIFVKDKILIDICNLFQVF